MDETNIPKRKKTGHPELVQYTSTGIYYYRSGGAEKSLKTTDYNTALKKLEIEKAKGGGSVNTSRLKVVDVAEDYKKFRRKQMEGKILTRRRIRESTYKEIEHIFKLHLIPFFGAKRLSKIDEDLWEEYCHWSNIGDLSNHRKVFGAFLRWCRRKKYIKFEPVLEIPAVRRRKRRLLTEAEILALFEYSRDGLHLFIAMALFQGMRRSEIMTLRWEHINFADRYLMIPETVSKTNQERLVTINSYCLELLARRKAAAASNSHWVFPNRDDKRKHADVSGLKGSWTRAKAKAKIKGSMTWNDLRATCEKYAHLSTEFTDAQREKFYGSSSEVQKRTYAHKFMAEELRGLEDAVQVPGLKDLLMAKLDGGEKLGNGVGSK